LTPLIVIFLILQLSVLGACSGTLAHTHPVSAEGEEIVALERRTVRPRGWIKLFNGAMIEVSHSKQIKVLE